MRKIKFRGKVKYNRNHKFYGDWIYGYYRNNENANSFITETLDDMDNYIFEETEVDDNTIGQFTGLHDKNGKEIYEGDIVELTDEGRQIYGTKEHPSRKYQLVGFKDGRFMTGRSNIDCEFFNTYLWILKDYITVVGNKFDNPELLEKGE